MTSTALAIHNAFQPTNFTELREFAEIAARTDMVPKDFAGKPGNIIIACQMGAELGMSVATAMQSFAIINGRATLWGDALIGLVRGSGKCEYIKEWIEGEQFVDPADGKVDVTKDLRVAYCETKRKGEPDPVVRSFSVQDARKAGIWMKDRSPWVTYPMRQMAMRARGFCLRDVYADVLRGVALAEEVSDYDQPMNVTPAAEAPATVAVRTRADAVRDALELAKRKNATAAEPEAAAVVEGVVEPPLPNFDHMLLEHIGDKINEEAQAAGMTPAELKGLIPVVTAGKKASRANAPAIVTAIRKWAADAKAAQAQAASETSAAEAAAPEPATPEPAAPAAPEKPLICQTHNQPVRDCEDDECVRKAQQYAALIDAQPSLLASA